MIAAASATCHRSRARRCSRFAGACLGLVIVGLLAQGVAYGQSWSGVIVDLPGTKTPSNDNGFDQLYRPDATADPAGNVTAVWRRRGPDAIQAARYDAAAGAWGHPVDLALVRPILFPVVAGDDHGNVVAAWTTDNLRTNPYTSSGADNLIQVARYTSVSGTWAPPRTIARAGTGAQFDSVAIAGNASGDVLLVWVLGTYDGRGGTNRKIQSSRYDAATGTWSSPVSLSASEGSAPLVDVDPAGNAMAVWSGGTSSQFARYTTATGTWTSAKDVGAHVGTFKLDSGGNAIAVWVERLTDSSFNQLGQVVKATRYTASSASWSAPVTLSPDGQWCNRPDLTMDAGGNAMVIFEYEDYPTTSRLKGIHATHYTAASSTWAGLDLVRDEWWHTSPRITVDASGNLTAAWHVANDFSPVKILAARRPAGGAWEAPVIVRRKWTHWESASLAPTLPVDQAGNVTLVWKHFDSPASGSKMESTQWLATGRGVQPTDPPGAPRNFGATVNGNTVNLTWSAPTTGAAPIDYVLLGRLSAGGPVVATVPMGSGMSFSVTAPNGTFVLSVRATNANGTGPESATLVVTVPQAEPAPGPPSILAANVTGTTVSFSWTPPASGAVANYVLVAGLTPRFSVPYATMTLGPSPGISVPGVPPGSYYVRVLAQNASGTSAASNEVMVMVAGAAVPAAPTLYPPVVTGSTVALSWRAGAGEPPTHYTLTASVTPGGAPIVTVPLTGTSMSFSDVPTGTYYLRLSATNAAGTSPPAQVTLNVP